MSECVGRRQVSPEVVPQQDHGLQAQLGPPLLYGVHKQRLRPLGVRGEAGPAALAEAQQVEGVDGPAPTGEGVQVQGPEPHAATKSVQQHHGGLVMTGGGGVVATVQGYRPQLVAVADVDKLFGQPAFYTW